MDNDTAAMAPAVAQPRPPPPRAAGGRRAGFFTFLKDGVLVTTRNRGLFLPLGAVHAARSLAMFAARVLAVRYLGPKANDEYGLPVLAILHKLLDGHWSLLPAGAAACAVAHMANTVLALAIKVATVCAAVASCSAATSIDGDPGRTTTLTLASLTGEVRRKLGGAMETAVFVQVVQLASAAAWLLVTLAVLAAADAYVVGPIISGGDVFLLLHLIAIPVVFIYCIVACEVAVVVSVAEPGLRGGGAFRRARRLTRGAKRVAQVALHGMLSRVMNKNVSRMHDVAVARLPDSIAAAAASFWLDAAVFYLVVGAGEVLYTATVTAYYFHCKRTDEEMAQDHIHVE